MGKKTPQAPTPPDPVKTAAAQGAINKDTAITQANLNRFDEYTPYGSSTWSQQGGRATPNWSKFTPGTEGEPIGISNAMPRNSLGTPGTPGTAATPGTPASREPIYSENKWVDAVKNPGADIYGPSTGTYGQPKQEDFGEGESGYAQSYDTGYFSDPDEYGDRDWVGYPIEGTIIGQEPGQDTPGYWTGGGRDNRI